MLVCTCMNAEIHESLNSSEDTNFIAFCGFCLDGITDFSYIRGEMVTCASSRSRAVLFKEKILKPTLSGLSM